MKRWTALALAGILMAALTACGGDDDGGDEAVDPPEEVATTTGGDGGDDDADGSAGDPCSLVPDALLSAVFPSGDAEADGNDHGAGFAECTWAAGETELVVSIVPAESYQSDYLDQLNVGPPIESAVLGDGAVGFPGLVGIGRVSADGSTVGFTSGDLGVLVAVRTGADGAPATDLPLAISIAEAIAPQL